SNQMSILSKIIYLHPEKPLKNSTSTQHRPYTQHTARLHHATSTANKGRATQGQRWEETTQFGSLFFVGTAHGDTQIDLVQVMNIGRISQGTGNRIIAQILYHSLLCL